jgi:hypothetical protein
MEIDILGIDLAKQVFQLHGADCRGRVLHRASLEVEQVQYIVSRCLRASEKNNTRQREEKI